MYILAKKDFNKICFNFKEGNKYPITNIFEDSYCFIDENDYGRTISKNYLKEQKEYLELKKEKLCTHNSEVKIYDIIICSKCGEVII
jgi:uncharacterized protein (DUF2237 family)